MTEELKPIDTSKYKITETWQVLKMTKYDMKDKLSMALKDTVLQQVFEIVCKNLVELKKENVEIKKQLTKAKELIEELSSSLSVVGECGEEECKLLNRAEQFLREIEK